MKCLKMFKKNWNLENMQEIDILYWVSLVKSLVKILSL